LEERELKNSGEWENLFVALKGEERKRSID